MFTFATNGCFSLTLFQVHNYFTQIEKISLATRILFKRFYIFCYYRVYIFYLLKFSKERATRKRQLLMQTLAFFSRTSHFRSMRRKAASFCSIGRNGSNNLCAENRIDIHHGSRFRAQQWNDDLHPRGTDSRWRRVSAEETYLMRRISEARWEGGGFWGGSWGLKRSGHDTVQAHRIGNLRQLRLLAG